MLLSSRLMMMMMMTHHQKHGNAPSSISWWCGCTRHVAQEEVGDGSKLSEHQEALGSLLFICGGRVWWAGRWMLCLATGLVHSCPAALAISAGACWWQQVFVQWLLRRFGNPCRIRLRKLVLIQTPWRMLHFIEGAVFLATRRGSQISWDGDSSCQQ